MKVQDNTKGRENRSSDCYADWTDLSLWGSQSGRACVAYLTGGNADMDATLAALSDASRVGVDCGLPVSKTGFEVGWQNKGFADDDPRIFLSSTQAYQRLLESENSGRVHFEYTASVPLEEGVTPQRGKTYTIANETQLHRLAAIVNSGNACAGATFQLLNDITLSEYAAWTPIGVETTSIYDDKSFQGEFEGGGHTIGGLAIDRSSADHQGLFGYVGASGKVKDLTVDGSVTGKNYVGGVAGYSAGTVEHCVNQAAISGNSLVGGLVGQTTGGKVTGCANKGAVTGTGGGVGGVVGQADKESPALPGLVENCSNTAAVTGGDQTGGVVDRTPSARSGPASTPARSLAPPWATGWAVCRATAAARYRTASTAARSRAGITRMVKILRAAWWAAAPALWRAAATPGRSPPRVAPPKAATDTPPVWQTAWCRHPAW